MVTTAILLLLYSKAEEKIKYPKNECLILD
mgnify:FL=1